MKLIYYLILTLIAILFSGCPELIVQPEVESEEWIVITDIDGSNLDYICKSEGAIPYFVPDLVNLGEELLLLDLGSRIDLIRQDGTERRTIIDSIGSVYSFSQDRSKLLLNFEDEIYISNVDGSDLQNLTNTPDIYERDPSFSYDNENLIIYTYSNTGFSNAYLIIKNISTNQDSIVFNYPANNENQHINFSNPFFQNSYQIIYNFKFENHVEEITEFYYEIHSFNMNNIADEIIFNDSQVYHFRYNYATGLALIFTDTGTLLFDIFSFELLHVFSGSSYHENYGFSSNANYLTVGEVIYSLETNFEYYIDMEDNDFNQNETRIVGIYSRKFPED